MKENFLNPEIEIVRIDVDDVITASADTGTQNPGTDDTLPEDEL